MPNYYDSICLACGEKYHGRGRYFCSQECTKNFQRGKADGKAVEGALNNFDNLFVSDFDPVLDIKCDNLLVCADIHAPYAHVEMIQKLIQIGEIYLKPPRTLVHVGDLVNFDAFSHYDLIDKQATPDKDLVSARLILNLLFQTFETVYLCIGNHDARFLRKLDWFFQAQDLGNIFSSSFKLHVSPYPYCNITSNGTTFHCTHPASYSRVGKVPVDLAVIHRKSVLSFHGHLFSLRAEPSGTDIGYDVGCMTKRNLHTYVRMRETTHPLWMAGFCMIKNGSIFPFTENEKITNWDFWLNELPGKLKGNKLWT
jgi:predicted phosphodiesterase